jgi:hypothetical protein
MASSSKITFLNDDSGGIQPEAVDPDAAGDWARIGLTSAKASAAQKPKVLMGQIRPESGPTIKPDLEKIPRE